jgi:hypothetical protein
MDDASAIEWIEELHSEIRRYLEAVSLYRELGHEPSWRPETHSSDLVLRVREWREPREQLVSGA